MSSFGPPEGCWTVLSTERVFSAPPYVTVTRERVRTDVGVEINGFYRVDLAPFVVCVPQPPGGDIVTIWQYKHGPRRWGLTFPAGYVDAGETPEAACRRELMEEAGYILGKVVLLGEFVDNGNQRGSLGSYYIASDCRWAKLPCSSDRTPASSAFVIASAV